MRPPRAKLHHWGDPVRDDYETRRTCQDCGLIKITDHNDPSGRTFIRWKRSEDAVHFFARITPQCRPVEIGGKSHGDA